MTVRSYAKLHDAHQTDVPPGCDPFFFIEPWRKDDPRIEIWYQINPRFVVDHAFDPDKTHCKIGEIRYRPDWENELFRHMQGEIWSPNGEARELIHRLKLSHTSLSIGDMIVVHDGNNEPQTYVCGTGWEQVS